MKKGKSQQTPMKFRELLGNTLKNLEEMDKFLDAYDPLKLTQEDINHINRSVMRLSSK
jgi:transcription termination factor NusB